MLAAKRVPMTGANDGAAVANGLLAFVAGEGMGQAVRLAALCARFDVSGTETTCAAWRSAALQMDVAMVAAATGVGTA